MSAAPASPGAPPSWTEEQLLDLVRRLLDEGNADRRRLIGLAEQHETNARARHEAVLGALGQLDASVDEVAHAPREGVGARITAWIGKQPAAYQLAMAGAAYQLIVSLSGAMVERLGGVAPTFPGLPEAAEVLPVDEAPVDEG